MKPTYQGFEEKNAAPFITLPPAGAYVAKIMAVRIKDAEPNFPRDTIEIMIDIDEGEYAGRYTEAYNDQKERLGSDKAKYKGIYRLIPPMDGDDDWRKRVFERAMWCLAESNPGFHWDWDEKKLQGKMIGINIRKRLYNYNGQDRETTEIGQFEVVQDVRDGKVKPMKPREQRTQVVDNESSIPEGFTTVNTESVPWD